MKLEKGDALVIVAHPDDETIWMGGTILQNQRLNWLIFSLCRGDDSDRSPKFKRVCDHYSAQSIITNIEDKDAMSIGQSIPLIRETILERLPQKKFSYIFTHNSNGEYGHPRHIGVHNAVIGLLKEKEISGKKIIAFAYNSAPSPVIASPDLSAAIQKKLPENVFKEKRFIMSNIYGFQKTTPDYQTAGPREAFDFLELI